jgi:phosphoglycolate phosphatase-like HAD superfamily hydrolase
MTLRALIFDVDGTLADTERDGHRVAFNAAFAESGLDWSWDEATYGELLHVAGGVERMVHYARAYRGLTQSDKELHAFVRELHASKTRHYVRCVAAGVVQLRPGIARLIAQARAQGLQLAIATTTTRDNVTALLQATLGGDAMDWFAAIGTAQEVATKKPHPAVYRWVLDCLRLRPCEALALEDSRNGLLAASRAGLPCIVTPTRYSIDEDFAEAIMRLSDLDHHPQRPGVPVSLDDLRGWQSRAVQDVDALRTR